MLHWICRLLAILCVLAPFESADAQNCGEVPRIDDESLKGEVIGKAQFLSGFLGKAELGGRLETAKRDIFSAYPNADAARTNAYFLYQMCESIFNDTSLTPKQMREEFTKVRREIMGTSPPKPAPKTPAKSSGSLKNIGWLALGTTMSDAQEQLNLREVSWAKDDSGMYSATFGGTLGGQSVNTTISFNHDRIAYAIQSEAVAIRRTTRNVREGRQHGDSTGDPDQLCTRGKDNILSFLSRVLGLPVEPPISSERYLSPAWEVYDVGGDCRADAARCSASSSANVVRTVAKYEFGNDIVEFDSMLTDAENYFSRSTSDYKFSMKHCYVVVKSQF